MKLTAYWIDKSAKKISKQLEVLEIKPLEKKLGVLVSLNQAEGFSITNWDVDDPEGVAGVLAYAVAKDLQLKINRDVEKLESYFKQMKKGKNHVS